MKKIKILSLLVIGLIIITGCSSSKNSLGKNQEVTYKNLKFSISESFEKSEMEDWIYYDWNDASGENKNSCSLSLNAYEPYGTPDLEEIVYDDVSIYADDESKIKTSTENINGVSWAKAEVINDNKSSVYAYAAIYNGTVYTIHYDDIGSGDICADVLTTVEKSLDFN